MDKKSGGCKDCPSKCPCSMPANMLAWISGIRKLMKKKIYFRDTLIAKVLEVINLCQPHELSSVEYREDVRLLLS